MGIAVTLLTLSFRFCYNLNEIIFSFNGGNMLFPIMIIALLVGLSMIIVGGFQTWVNRKSSV